MLGNMPVQSTVPDLKVTRPEVYFGELTNTDVYVRTRQKEFNYPQGETNNETSYEGSGGIQLGGIFRRLLIAIDRGDLTKMPFSDDISSESRLLMRRNIRDRVQALAPFLTFDPDPVHRRHRRRKTGVGDGRIHHIGNVSVRASLSTRKRAHQLRSQRRQGDDRRVRRDGDVLRLRRGGSDHRPPIARYSRRSFATRARCRQTCGATCGIQS